MWCKCFPEMFLFQVSVCYLLPFLEIFLQMALDTFKIHFRFETVFRHILTKKWHNLDTIWTVEIWISSTYLIRILFILQLSNNYFKTHFRHNLEKKPYHKKTRVPKSQCVKLWEIMSTGPSQGHFTFFKQ